MPSSPAGFVAGTEIDQDLIGDAYRHWTATRLSSNAIAYQKRHGHGFSQTGANGGYFDSATYVYVAIAGNGTITNAGGLGLAAYGAGAPYPEPKSMSRMSDSRFVAAARSTTASSNNVAVFTLSGTTLTKGTTYAHASATVVVKGVHSTKFLLLRDLGAGSHRIEVATTGVNDAITVGSAYDITVTNSALPPEDNPQVFMFSETEGVVFHYVTTTLPYGYWFYPFTITGSTVTWQTLKRYQVSLSPSGTIGNVYVEQFDDRLCFTYTDTVSSVSAIKAVILRYDSSTRNFTTVTTSTFLSDLNELVTNGSVQMTPASSTTAILTLQGTRKDRDASAAYALYVEVPDAPPPSEIDQTTAGFTSSGSINVTNPHYTVLTPDGSVRNAGTFLAFTADTTQIHERSIAEFNEVVTSPFSSVYANERALTWDGTHFWTAESGSTPRIHRYTAAGSRILSLTSPSANPGGIAHDGTNVWVADMTSNIVYKLNPTTGATISSFTSPQTAPSGIAWDGTNICVLGRTNSVLAKLNPSTGAQVSSFSVATGDQKGLVWDGTAFWINYGSEGILRKYTSTGGLGMIIEHAVLSAWGLANDGTNFWLLKQSTGTFHKMAIEDPIPDDFSSIGTLTWESFHRLSAAATDDTYTLASRIVSEDGTVILAAADAAGTYQNVGNVTSTTLTSVGPTSYTYTNQTTSQALWNTAKLQLRQTWTGTLAADGAAIWVDQFQLISLYVKITPGATASETDTANAGSATVQSDPTYAGTQVAETDVAHAGGWDQGAIGVKVTETNAPVSGSATATPYGGPMQYLRPDGTTGSGTWVTQSGSSTNLHLTLDEVTPDDTDYIEVTL
jgi:hypothetical protein